MSFKEVEKQVMKLYNEERYKEAVDLLERVKDKYPEHLYSVTWDSAIFCLLMEPKNIEKSLDILNYGYDKGLFYSIDPNSGIWESLKDNDRFNEFVTKNNNRLLDAQAKAKFDYKVYLPEKYNKEKKYPLHIAIHGAGENIDFFKPYWDTDLLSNEYITLFVQSSKVISSIGYEWFEDIELSKHQIKNAFDEVVNNYNIDLDNVTIGGFSQGGTLALDITLNNLIPSKGFISLCPLKPENFNSKLVSEIHEKGIKGVILTGEMDQALPGQKEMVSVFDEIGFKNMFIINPNLGHWFPENLAKQLSEALTFLK